MYFPHLAAQYTNIVNIQPDFLPFNVHMLHDFADETPGIGQDVGRGIGQESGRLNFKWLPK